MKLAALDIETDTAPLTDEELAAGYTSRGLDPHITEITAISVATDDAILVFDEGGEDNILRNTIQAIAYINPTALGTWNGAVFDLPFITDRARLHGLETGIRLNPNPDIVPKYEPTPGHEGGYDAMWGSAHHIDVAYAMKDTAERLGVKWSLKPVAKALGFQPVEVDREKMHELTLEELHEYVASDANITLELLRRALKLDR